MLLESFFYYFHWVVIYVFNIFLTLYVAVSDLESSLHCDVGAEYDYIIVKCLSNIINYKKLFLNIMQIMQGFCNSPIINEKNSQTQLTLPKPLVNIKLYISVWLWFQLVEDQQVLLQP